MFDKYLFCDIAKEQVHIIYYYNNIIIIIYVKIDKVVYIKLCIHTHTHNVVKKLEQD